MSTVKRGKIVGAQLTTNKYWENEEPTIFSTQNAEIRYYENAGKIQIYSIHERDGEPQLSRACVWDTSNIDANDALQLLYGIMVSLAEKGLKNKVFSEAYELIATALDVEYEVDDEEEVVSPLECEELLNSLDFSDIREIADNMGLKVEGTKSRLINLLINPKSINSAKLNAVISDVVGTNDLKGAITSLKSEKLKYVYNGELLTYSKGKAVKTSKSTKGVYITWCDDAFEWTKYIFDNVAEIADMPTKNNAQRKAKETAFDKIQTEAYEWVTEWGDDKRVLAKVRRIVKSLLMQTIPLEEANVKFVSIIDKMEL